MPDEENEEDRDSFETDEEDDESFGSHSSFEDEENKGNLFAINSRANKIEEETDQLAALIGICTVNFNQNQSGTIEVREGDDLQVLVRDFIEKHGLKKQAFKRIHH